MVPNTIDEYIASSPSSVRSILKKIRQIVRSVAPNAVELISYRMPAFRLNHVLIYFAAFRDHIGIYPPISGDKVLMTQLKRYSGPKGNLKFPLDQPIPYDLIRKIVKFRVKQELAQTLSKKK
jgi:uncharacterized protein YdhG (YjbR/CyaY superfamily)